VIDTEKNLPRSLVMIGMMGAGKTCIGRRIARHYDVPFIDADREIEEAAGCSIADIFALYGESSFRDGERRVIKRLLEGPACVLATGGGAYMNTETRAMIAESGRSVWLKATVDVLVKRTTGRTHRPLLNTGDPVKTLQKLVGERYPIYEEADITIETFDEPLEKTVDRVLSALKQ